MLRDKALRFLLSIPLLNEFTEVAIKIATSKKSIKNVAINQFKFFDSRKRNSSKLKFDLLSELAKFHWIIQICAPSGEDSKLWGDTHFANEIARSLTNLDQEVSIIFRDENIEKVIRPNSIILNLRGLMPLETIPGHINLIWIISHPSQISKYELKKYDFIFAASEKWAESRSKIWNIPVTPLLQATNPDLFKPVMNKSNPSEKFLFIGNTRGKFRKIVKVASKSTKDFRVIGTGWEKYLNNEKIKSRFVANERLAFEYQDSEFVLADHWPDMAKDGFISNRLFDVVATGTKVISDKVPGSKEIFGSALVEFENETELNKLLTSDLGSKFGSSNEIAVIAEQIRSVHNFDNRMSDLLQLIQQGIRKLI